MKVWSFQTGIDFTEFQFVDEAEKVVSLNILDDAFQNFKSVNDIWKTPIMLRGEPKRKLDVFEIENTGIIAISDFARENLEEHLTNVELLPIETDAGCFYAINLLEPLDCLDLEKSEFSATNNGKIISYKNLDFQFEKVKDAFIYRIPQFPYITFLTLNFYLKYFKCDMRGLVFDEGSNLIWRH